MSPGRASAGVDEFPGKPYTRRDPSSWSTYPMRPPTSTRLRAALLLAAALAPFPAQSGTSPEAGARELMAASGLSRNLTATQQSIGEQAALQAADQGAMSPEESSRLADLYGNAFDAERMETAIVAAIAADFDADRARELLAWYATPPLQKVLAAYADLDGKEGEQKLSSWLEEIQNEPPAQQRLDLAQRLDAATATTDQLTALVGSLTVAMIRGHAAVTKSLGLPASSEAEIEATFTMVQEQIRPVMQQQALLILLYTSRQLDDDELLAYATSAEGPAQQWFSKVRLKGFERGYSGASRRIGEELGKWLPQRVDRNQLEVGRAQGRGFGAGKVDAECLATTLEREQACQGLSCQFQAQGYLASCLEVASRTEQTCADVPDREDIVLSAQWQAVSCSEIGRSDEFCRQILRNIQRNCHAEKGA